jgi:ATP/maltotriose-dependent transcriptional regulator MalT
MNIQTARQWIANGKRQKALQWLQTQSDNPDVLLLKALCIDEEKNLHWHNAIEALSQYPSSKDLLLALGQGIAQARKDHDALLQEQYLLRAITVASDINNPIQHIHWISILANLHLRQGNPEKGLPFLKHSVQLSIAHEHHLVIIAQGLILIGLWFSKGDINRVSALSLSIEDAAIHRHNWIALATVRNTRASCLLIREQHSEAIQLLLETGDFLYSKGAVSALNIVKARLGEIHLLLGKETVRTIIQQLQNPES